MQVLRIILPRGKGSKFMKILKANKAKSIACFYGEGSAPSEILNTLSIDKTKKEIVVTLIDESTGENIIETIADKLEKINTAIAFSTSLEGAYNMEYVCLYVIVDRHRGQEAIHIAQNNGARGATVIHGRGSSETVKSPIFLNMNIEPEKDLVIMLIKKELEDKIRDDIYKKMDLEKQGMGIIYSLPVTSVKGLVEQKD